MADAATPAANNADANNKDATTAAGGGAAAEGGETAAAGGLDAFNTDDLELARQRRERAKAVLKKMKPKAKAPNRATESSLADAVAAAVDQAKDGNKSDADSISDGADSGEEGGGKDKKPKRNVISQPRAADNDRYKASQINRLWRTKNVVAKDTAPDPRKMGDDTSHSGSVSSDDSDYSEQAFQAGNKTLTRWPYDDYHLVQKEFYERHDDPIMSLKALRGKDVPKTIVPVFSRPPDPPDIAAAMIDLPLTDFGQKAEERAITILSTWLFDAGLIHELIHFGDTGGKKEDGAGDGVYDGSNAFGIQGHTGESKKPTEHHEDANKTSAATDGDFEISALDADAKGLTKMDHEIDRLRTSTRRQLTLVNSRLDNTVNASGNEIQDLVDAVIATKDDLRRLQRLSTYISTADDQAERFLLTKYPHLKQAINARRNLARCFRELEFFRTIPYSCTNMRDRLHADEWTAQEWATLRDVCREHVELEIFLVEAEWSIKKRLVDPKSSGNRRGSVGEPLAKVKADYSQDVGLPHNVDQVDRFLRYHLQNVWELGDEIRLRIIHGITNCLSLVMQNPAGMVALVEAVEHYEIAHKEYRDVHGEEEVNRMTNLRFTDMRYAALAELYKAMEDDCDVEMGDDNFASDEEKSDDDDDDDDDDSDDDDSDDDSEDKAEKKEAKKRSRLEQKFAAVLKAANQLTRRSMMVKENMVPCFPPFWEIEMIWCTCVAHVCSNQILHYFGGVEGTNIEYLTPNNLLDLVAWMENFIEVINDSFPEFADRTIESEYDFDLRPDLFRQDKKTGNKVLDMTLTKDSLIWVYNILWDVHDSARDEWLLRTSEECEMFFDKVYKAEHTKSKSKTGRLFTSLCEDVFGLVGVQLEVIRERLPLKSEALFKGVNIIFKSLYEKQLAYRDSFLTDLESCCGAANDFIRMTDKCEEFVDKFKQETELSNETTGKLEDQAAALFRLYSNDSIYAAQKVHIYIFESIEENVAKDLFGAEWLDEWTDNVLADDIIQSLDEDMEQLEKYLDDVMIMKLVESLVTGSVLFYVKVLLTKSDEHNSNRQPFFSNCAKALERMTGDIEKIRSYFEELSEEYPSIEMIIENEFDEFLEKFQELMSIAAGQSDSEKEEYIMILQKRVKSFDLTKFLVGDIWHLMNPSEESKMYELLEQMKEEMSRVAPDDVHSEQKSNDRSKIPSLRLDQVLARHVSEGKRKRPLGTTFSDAAAKTFGGWFGSGS